MEGLVRNWWLFALRGALALVFGFLLLARPGVGLAALVLLYGAYALVEGGFLLASAMFGGARRERLGYLVFGGIVSAVTGLFTLMWPGISAVALFLVIAVWAIVLGVFQIAAAIRLRMILPNEWLLGLGGALAVLLGVVMLASPMLGLAVLIGVLSGFAFLFGFVNLALGVRLRRLGGEMRVT